MSVILIIICFIAIIGAPLFSVIGGISLVNFLGIGKILVVPQEMAGITNTALLHSIPLFTFAGYILAKSNASKRLVRLSEAAFGWMPGGLAIVTLIACAIFTAFTGASSVTIVALGGLLIPALLSDKYDERFSLGLVTASGSVGLLFPPSLVIILYGVIASTSIESLYVAGAIPGIIIILTIAVYAIFKRRSFKTENKFSMKEVGAALWDIKWELPLPILLFGGIFSGKMAISDSAAFTVLYVLVAEIFLTKDVKIKDLPNIVKESMELVGAILVILTVSLAATNYIIYKEIPNMLFDMTKGIIINKFMFLLALNIFLIIVGCIMDIFSALMVIVPLILPLAEAYNVDSVHLGIIFLANLEIGYLTPPVGMNLFISSIRFNKSIVEIYKASVPFILLSLLSLGLITYVPWFSTWFMDKTSIVGKWEYEYGDGIIDSLTIKSGGKYFRAKGDMMEIIFAEPIAKNYKISKDSITFLAEEETYKYEIFNRGKRLKLTDINGAERFYQNKMEIEIPAKTGFFISGWIDELNDVKAEFYLNGMGHWIEKGEEKSFRYEVNQGKLSIITMDDEIEKKEIYKYKISKLKDSFILYGNNKKFNFNISEEISDL